MTNRFIFISGLLEHDVHCLNYPIPCFWQVGLGVWQVGLSVYVPPM